MMKPKDSLKITLNDCGYDRYEIVLNVPITDYPDFNSEEEWHGFVISAVEALIAKGTSGDE